MIKPLGRWCAVIALNFAPVYALAADPTTAAQDSANAVMQQFGSGDGIRQNASLPLTSDNSQLFTIDRTDSSSVQISNPSSNAFLTISIQQSATGDLRPIRVSQDLNFDGVFDYTYQVPFHASGICANGIISSCVCSTSSSHPSTPLYFFHIFCQPTLHPPEVQLLFWCSWYTLKQFHNLLMAQPTIFVISLNSLCSIKFHFEAPGG